MCVVPCVTSMINYYHHDHDYVIIIVLTLHFYVEQSQVTCRYIINIIMPS